MNALNEKRDLIETLTIFKKNINFLQEDEEHFIEFQTEETLCEMAKKIASDAITEACKELKDELNLPPTGVNENTLEEQNMSTKGWNEVTFEDDQHLSHPNIESDLMKFNQCQVKITPMKMRPSLGKCVKKTPAKKIAGKVLGKAGHITDGCKYNLH